MKNNKWYALGLLGAAITYLLTAKEGTGFLILLALSGACFFDDALIDE